MQLPKHLLIQKKGSKEAWRTDGTNKEGKQDIKLNIKRNI